ncbi:MAG: ABC transporter permease [Acetobacteraceae bacterium]|nr:ABC transporter permease [Acetobacteraceae bacterium]
MSDVASDLASDVVRRPEIIRPAQRGQDFGVVEKALTLPERLYNQVWLRKGALLVVLALAWEAYARHLDNPLLVPTFTDTLAAWWDAVSSGVLPQRAWASLQVLAVGFGAGVVLAGVLTVLAITTRIGTDFLETMTAMFNPLPAIALLPLAMIWFGLGIGSLVFVLIHSVLWAVALNTHAGFRGVSQTLRMVGRNYGLSGLRLVFRILIPAAFPSILAGLKIGWAFAWRTLIAAELVFGVASGKGGLGWFIFESKNELDIPSVFAGLLTIIMIGLVVENVVFRTLENRTIRRWGMQH